MSNKRAGVLALALLGWGGFAHALGLGEIEVRSRLNQPLLAVIPVSSTTAGELDNVVVELAGNEDFERAGLERPEFLSSLRFVVQGNSIRVTSKQSAREPFVSFLLDVRWDGGRLLREYTVLLDPPAMAPSAPTRPAVVAQPAPSRPAVVQAPAPERSAAVEAAPEASSAEAPAEAPVATEAPAEAEPAPAAPSRVAGETYGPVAPKETLWSIAFQLRPDPSLTMDQMQVAIFSANPRAFQEGRLTGLMKGVMLRVPSLDEIRAVDPVAAKSQVAAARAGAAAAPVPRAEAPQAEPAPEPAPAPAPEEAPAETSAAPAPAETVAEAPAEAAPAETPPAEPVAEAPAEAPAAAPVETQPAPEMATAEPEPTEGGLMAELVERGRALVNHPLFFPAAAGIVILLLLLVLTKWARSKYAQWSYTRALRKAPVAGSAAAAEAADEDATQVADAPTMQETLEQESAAQAPTVMGAAQAMPEPVLERTSQQTMQQTVQQPAATQTQAVEPALAQSGGKLDFDVTGNFASETVQINLDAGDPVSEAEFHRAYGLYDEAALLLKQALQKDPKRTDARVKLAEIYFEASKTKEFVEVARELKAQLPLEEWQKIALLGTQVAPDDELFKGGAVDVGGAVDLSFDEPSAAAPVPSAAAPAAPTAPAADLGLDFKLEDIQLPETPAPSAATPAAAAPADTGLEFDLGSLSLDTPPEAPAKPAAPAAPTAGGGELSLDLGEFDFKTDSPAAATPAPAGAGAGEVVEMSMDMPLEEAQVGGAGDESSTKLDLARAYIDMGDGDMAKSLLNEVAQQGNDEQKREAQELLKRVPG